MASPRLIETDAFPFEFLSELAERESWRKEIHRPIYHIHKWWAKRLGSVFRGILLGCALDGEADLRTEFFRAHFLRSLAVFDPFMGSGTTVGEAHKLGLTALGRDINPVAAESARVAFGPMNRKRLLAAFRELSEDVEPRIRRLYRSTDSRDCVCEALYYFWVMQVPCTSCREHVDLFPSWIIASDASPERRPKVRILCPGCGRISRGLHGRNRCTCEHCGLEFDPRTGNASGSKATCRSCGQTFAILDSIGTGIRKPDFRMYAKLVLRDDDQKEYLAASAEDHDTYRKCSELLGQEVSSGRVQLPTLGLEAGHNTRQAMRYGFRSWRDFFNDRQLLALGWLHAAIGRVRDEPSRDALLLLFSGVLEFNNLFASYKGEGTGAVRHMFSHHILKPERTPIEANVWGTPKSSGSFSNLFRSRLLRAVDYRLNPSELPREADGRRVSGSAMFDGSDGPPWPLDGRFEPRAIYLSCGDSALTGLPDQSIDFIVTDPPFFDNVHYSELADFFYAWQQLLPRGFVRSRSTTRHPGEVQDTDAARFSEKLRSVFQECHRILKPDGLLVFTYHHSREDGWKALADAILEGGFRVVNSHPVKSEMSVAAPKSQAREPIQIDIVIVCSKKNSRMPVAATKREAIQESHRKLDRLMKTGLSLSAGDRRIVILGQLLTALSSSSDVAETMRADPMPLDSPVG